MVLSGTLIVGTNLSFSHSLNSLQLRVYVGPSSIPRHPSAWVTWVWHWPVSWVLLFLSHPVAALQLLGGMVSASCSWLSSGPHPSCPTTVSHLSRLSTQFSLLYGSCPNENTHNPFKNKQSFSGTASLNSNLEGKKTKHSFKANINDRDLASERDLAKIVFVFYLDLRHSHFLPEQTLHHYSFCLSFSLLLIVLCACV